MVAVIGKWAGSSPSTSEHTVYALNVGESLNAKENNNLKIRSIATVLFASAMLILPLSVRAQQSVNAPDAPSATLSANRHDAAPMAWGYKKPSERLKVRNYLFEAFGPYPIIGAAAAAGINQADNTPPEWKQGAEAFGKRLGSNFGIAAVATTTRYALAEAFREDTLYYRCECTGFFPRLKHAALSTMTARKGEDGHRVFSIPSLVAPYAGTMTAVYGWYPDRYNAEDGFRMGNYSLLAYVGGNIAQEFLFTGPHSFMARLHLNNGHEAQDPNAGP